METSVYRLHTPAQPLQFLANVSIPGELPITPERIAFALQGLELSSPPERYTTLATHPTSGPAAIYFRHQDNERNRLISKQAQVADLRNQMQKFEERFGAYVKAQEKEKEEEKVPIYKWETYSRLAQAMNDFLKKVIMAASLDSDSQEEYTVACAQSIWDESDKVYLPHIYAVWWTKSHKNDPHTYALPWPLSELRTSSPRVYNSYATMPALEDHISTGLHALYASHWRPLLDLMLVFHIGRDGRRNFIQHPSPTRQFAMAFIGMAPGLSNMDRIVASKFINFSSSEKDGISSPMFDLGDGLEANNVDD